jgi:hypothetical protein
MCFKMAGFPKQTDDFECSGLDFEPSLFTNRSLRHCHVFTKAFATESATKNRRDRLGGSCQNTFIFI